MPQTLDQQARAWNNDYSALETIYCRTTGGELVSDPYDSVRRNPPELTLSASVVIPAWNARQTIESCLVAIEQSSFNRKHPEQLEVIVVDDGSTDGTWELLQKLRLNLRLKAAQQMHHSRAQTQNTGIALAEGDVVISCDADMILTPFSLEELVKRHQVLRKVMLIGFRGDVSPTDPRIQPHALPKHLPGMLPPFSQDIRLTYHTGGWPESMCRDSHHLKRLGQARYIYMADGGQWNLSGMVYGALFSLRRDDFTTMDGYDERFYGWGCEDTLVGVRALALERYIVPVYSAAGLHIAHGDRSRHKWREFAANRRVFQAILNAPFKPEQRQWLPKARQRILDHYERAPASLGYRAGQMTGPQEAFETALTNPSDRGKYFHSLGRYAEAAGAFGQVSGSAEAEAWAAFDQGKSLRAAGCVERAVETLEDASRRLPASPWPLIEWGLALAAQGRFAEARQRLEQAGEIDPANATLRFLLRQPVGAHLRRAARYAEQEDFDLAVRDYEAALIIDPKHAPVQADRAAALAKLGRTQAARQALGRYVEELAPRERYNSLAHLELARLHLALDELGAAKVRLEQAHRARPHDPAVKTQLAEVQVRAAKRYPLPLPGEIVKISQTIPGWLTAAEAELLTALTWRAVAPCDAEEPPRLVEIGSYCGRATVTMALALRSLGRTEARIISIDEPALGPTPEGQVPRQALAENLAAHEVAELVTLSPEAEPEPWQYDSRLVLVDGQHDYASVQSDVARFGPTLSSGGFLVFHDYAAYFPEVQRCVDELLLGNEYEFVAQADSLIALVRRANGASGQKGSAL